MSVLIFITIGCGLSITTVIARLIYCLVSKKPFTSIFVFIYNIPFQILFWLNVIITIIKNYKYLGGPEFTVPEKFNGMERYIINIVKINNIEYLLLGALAVWILGAFIIRVLSGLKILNIFRTIKVLVYTVSVIFLVKEKQLIYLIFSIYVVALWLSSIFFAGLNLSIKKSRKEKITFYRQEKEERREQEQGEQKENEINNQLKNTFMEKEKRNDN